MADEKAKVEGSTPLSLDHILSNLDEINKVVADKEVTITHKRLGADFTFLAPHISELSKVADKSGAIIIDEVYKAVNSVMVTRITEDMLKAIKVGTQLEAVKKLFSEDEIMIVFASISEGVEDTTIAVKKL